LFTTKSWAFRLFI